MSNTVASQLYGIDFMSDELEAWDRGLERFPDTLNRILENGFMAKQAKLAGDMTELHENWLTRCNQVLTAVREYYTLLTVCSDELLKRHNIPVPVPWGTN
jgi:hypothetical protein